VLIVDPNQYFLLDQGTADSSRERLPTDNVCRDLLVFEDRTQETDNLRVDGERMEKVLLNGIGKDDPQPGITPAF